MYINMLVNLQFVFLLLICRHYCSAQPSTDTPDVCITKDNIMQKFPKCCMNKNQYWDIPDKCVNITEKEMEESKMYHYFYESNETHINSNSVVFDPIFDSKNHMLSCEPSSVLFNEIIGFTSNGSAIIRENKRVIFINFEDYCLDSLLGKLAMFVCKTAIFSSSAGMILLSNETLDAQTYIPSIVISTCCYYIAAIIYQFVLESHEGHRTCFTAYSISMGTTFLCLILLQKVNLHCTCLGSIFFMFMLASCVWLYCICHNTTFSVKTFMKADQTSNRFKMYTTLSIIVPVSMLLISIIPSGIPDVPRLFTKNLGSCTFKGEDTRVAILFVPVICLIVISTLTVIYSFFLIRQFDKIYKCDIIWLEKRNLLRYMTHSCSLILITSSFWIVDAGLEIAESKISVPAAYSIIEGLQGVLVMVIFAFDRETRKDIYKVLCTKRFQMPKSKRFSTLLKKFKSERRVKN
ncbi:unnamed protein product [Diabrotica balteata]|uniref:Uncharacterized protein n=1 Tax=Diabrotica balteata TaxID=107213 RepID=A0A9N9SY27_DIABA|nr:unnamed protein product [Diabrotica balteata]